MRRLLLLALRMVIPLVLVVGLLDACSDDGSGSEQADRGTDASTGAFELTSPAFDEGEPIPPEFSLAGGDTSPPLAWTGVPPATEELALTVVDPDAGNFVHWVVTGIDPAVGRFEKGSVPDGAVENPNSFDETDWGGPAPPPGSPHTYVFTLYALNEPLTIAPDTPAADAVAQIETAGGDTAVLRGTFEQR